MTEAERIAEALDKEQVDTVRRDVLNHAAAALLLSQAAEIERLKESNTRLRMENSSHAERMARDSAALRAEVERLKEAQVEAEETISILNSELSMFYKPRQEEVEPVGHFYKDRYGYLQQADEEKSDETIPLCTAPQGQTALLRQALEAIQFVLSAHGEQLDTAFSDCQSAVANIKQHLGEA